MHVLADGEYWSAHPIPLSGAGIVPSLGRLIGAPILNMAMAGDEVHFMRGVEERKLLSARLSAGYPAGGAWDVLQFSRAGNDIVAKPMALWVGDFDPTLMPEQHLHAVRFDTTLALVQAGSEDLIAIRDRLSPHTHLTLRAYDFCAARWPGVSAT